jgi:hypothetical protein
MNDWKAWNILHQVRTISTIGKPIERTWWRIFQAFQSLILSVPDEGYSRLSNRWYWGYLMKDIPGTNSDSVSNNDIPT